MTDTKPNGKKKILFLITKSNWGGAQRYVYDLAVALPKDRYAVSVALGGDGALCTKLTEANVHVIQIPALQRNISFSKEIAALWNIAQIIRSEDPDVLHINSSKAGALGAFLGRILGVPHVVFTAHGWAFNEDRSLISRLLIKCIHWITVLFAHTTIAVSQKIKDQMNWPFVRKKMVVIHNGRDVPILHERSAARQLLIEHTPELAQYADDFWSVTIGELHPIKQHHVTIQALADIVQKHKDVRHIIISDGEERQKLEEQVMKLSLNNNVFFTGSLPEAAQYLKAFDLFVLSSRSEALAYVIIEACIAKLPIIASNVGGIPEIITHKEDGLLFPSGDTATLATLYNDLLEDKQTRDRLAEKALQRAQHFTFEKVLQKTTAVYNR